MIYTYQYIFSQQDLLTSDANNNFKDIKTE